MTVEARNRSLPDWFTRIRTHQTVLPRFQRFEAWNPVTISDLFNTILQGLPVGAALVLEIGDKQPFVSRPLKGAPEEGDRVTEQLLDGQQRLTALWRALHNNYDDRTYFVFLSPDEETGLPYYVDSIARWKKEEDIERRPFWANRARQLWQRRMVPLDLCRWDIAAQQELKSWIKDGIDDASIREDVSDRIAEIRTVLHSFNLPFLSLPVSTKKETALDVFIRMNTSAEPLSTFDIVVAQVEAGMGQSLHDLVSEVRRLCPTVTSYYPPEQLVLYGSALLQERIPGNATYLSPEFGSKLLSNWDRLVRGLKRATAFLEDEHVFDAARLPTDVVVPVLAALWAVAPVGLDAEGRARTILRKYTWRAFVTKRYEKSTSSRALVDFTELKSLILAKQDASATVFDPAEYPIPTEPELIDAGWPVRKERLARAILAIALRHGGHDLADGGQATRSNLAQREYHHLFPVAHLAKIGVPDQQAYRALNCALVTWRTNRNISAKDPERYLAERREGTELGEDEVRARLASHLIPFDELVAGDYTKFLEKRAEDIHKAMVTLCGGGT